jgi:nitroreductase
VTDQKRLKKLAKVWRGAGHVARSAATIALIAPDASDRSVRDSIQYDLGQLTMSIMLAATDLGIGTGHSSVRNQRLARRLLELPEGSFCAWLIALGHPKEPMRPINHPARRDFDDVVHREVW